MIGVGAWLAFIFSENERLAKNYENIICQKKSNEMKRVSRISVLYALHRKLNYTVAYFTKSKHDFWGTWELFGVLVAIYHF